MKKTKKVIEKSRKIFDCTFRHGFFLGLRSPFTPSLYKRHYMLPMKIYSYLSYRREINETDEIYPCNFQKVCRDSPDSLNGGSYSTISMISGFFTHNRNAITVGKGRGKGKF